MLLAIRSLSICAVLVDARGVRSFISKSAENPYGRMALMIFGQADMTISALASNCQLNTRSPPSRQLNTSLEAQHSTFRSCDAM
ncbi:hypothetical protein B0H14DRAFT_1051940 [Mycena olivaceomarginata]|nr:hypothetical protein B0H14DRAFT_1051940 [Mycena olivaceomarginata]